MRNLKLLEKYQPSPPPPPPAIKIKENLNLQENEKTSLLVCFNHPKIASTIMKRPQTPDLKILNFSKNPDSIGKV